MAMAGKTGLLRGKQAAATGPVVYQSLTLFLAQRGRGPDRAPWGRRGATRDRGGMMGVGGWRETAAAVRLTRGNGVLERVGVLLVHELDGKALFEVAYHARLHDAEQHLRLQGRPVLGRDRRAR